RTVWCDHQEGGNKHAPTDKPSAPINFTFDEIRSTSVICNWDVLWVKANDTVVRTTEYPCAGLIEGLEYTFRVSAINRAGQGKPSSKTDFVTARTPQPKCAEGRVHCDWLGEGPPVPV
uniref:Fibronectin type-III domain-containing protein n=1 Tax=Gouania willdenowi TaxID=441366 RepID=A0A8C5DTT2_GOUWI